MTKRLGPGSGASSGPTLLARGWQRPQSKAHARKGAPSWAESPSETSWEQLALSPTGPALGSSGLPGLQRDAKKHSPQGLSSVKLPILRSMGSCWKGAVLTQVKAHSLTGRINLDSLEDAFWCVRRNRGPLASIACPLICMSVSSSELAALERRLKGGTYQSFLCDASTSPRATQGNTPAGHSRSRRPRCSGDGSLPPEPSLRGYLS